MSVLEVGVPDGISTRNVEKFPVRYQLRRSEYILFAEADTTSTTPTLVFWAINPGGDSVVVQGQSIPCVGAFTPLLDIDTMKQRFPGATEKFVWRPTDSPSCNKNSISNNDRSKLRLVVTIAGRTRHTESVPFEVVRNGTFYVIDSI